MSLSNHSVLILGLGISGLSMARWCASQGAAVFVADSRSDPPQLAALRAELPQVMVRTGSVGERLPDGVDCVCVSPGIAPSDPAFAGLLDKARASGVRVTTELGLFTAALRELHRTQGYAPAVLAVTGTNGKTTVTALTAHLLRGAGVDTAVAGNIGPALLDTLGERMHAGSLPQAWVLELSSFQLHGVDDLAATAATVLNLTQDHLDWHGSMEAYGADKARIFGPQPWPARPGSDAPSERHQTVSAAAGARVGDAQSPGLMLLNRDDARVLAMRRDGRQEQTFGLDAPQRAGDWGVVVEHGMSWLARGQAQQGENHPRRRGKGTVAEPSGSPSMQLLMPADALRIHGRHNWANALAALGLAASTGAPLAPMLHALRSYAGEPHRMQSLGVIAGVEWIEDSKGTNVGATVAALAGLDRSVVLIAGGDGKGQDFSPLLRASTGRLRAAVLIGRDAPRLAQALNGVCPIEQTPSLEQAVRRAGALAREGDIVLLSPACASLDMFRDYTHRAEVFAGAVAEWALEHGMVLEGAP
ncbi:MAG: UDP-N-acetylmuramoyl-L-alanine--D-glutamate ligase [Betaproteobacteria bacterium]|nr:UDP-N-acetylmuramoyl-L-alanine--D-glutamate ligase [Betaproteobacteria bacterium]